MLKKIMLGKLIKYELLATGRLFLPLYGILVVICTLCRIFNRFTAGQTISVIMMIALGVLIVVVTIQRFLKNLLGSEGYLMFTLPVTTDSLIWSKILASAIWVIVSAGIIFVSAKILPDSDFVSPLKYLGQSVFSGHYTVVESFKMAATGVLGLFSGILTVYACLSLSMLVNKRRMLFAFGMFIVFSFISQIADAAFAAITRDMVKSNDGPWGLVPLFPLLAANIALYFITRYMLRRRLNLE